MALHEKPQRDEPLRVAFLAGSLHQGGAEKQFLYMLEALRQCGVTIQVCTITRGEHYEAELLRKGFQPHWIGQSRNPFMRTLRLANALRPFRPHLIQSTHVFSNLYAALAARLMNTISIGSIRNDGDNEIRSLGAWGPWMVRLPSAVIANSHAAQSNLSNFGAAPEKVHVLNNVIDLEAFQQQINPAQIQKTTGKVTVIAVGRLVKNKRFERYLQVLASARKQVDNLTGLLVGDGPERPNLEALARDLGLIPNGLTFLGRRDDIPTLLSGADILMLTSQHEGFPNIIMEAMAARLPVIATPAGDSAVIVQEGLTGHIHDFEDIQGMADRLVELALSPAKRNALGENGFKLVSQKYNFAALGNQLLSIYQKIGELTHNHRLMAAAAEHQPSSLGD